MTGRYLLNLAIDQDQNHGLAVNTQLCKRVRHRQNECQRCLDICPEAAIEFSVGPLVNDNCSQCGLCVNACPTETFQYDTDMEQYWLDQVKTLANKQLARTDHNKILNFHCHHAQAQSEHSIAINCIGNISENLLLSGAINGFKQIWVHTGNCHDCNNLNGVSLFKETVEQADAIARLINIHDLIVQSAIMVKVPNEEVLSRRGFFNKLSREVKQRSLPADYAQHHPLQQLFNTEADESTSGPQPSQRRMRLRALFAETSQTDQATDAPALRHWRKMVVEEEKCVACAVCVNVCPTGALDKIIQDNTLYRYYHSALCTNCSLCQEACPQQIIHFKDNYTLTDIVEDQSELVARVELTQCLICGETIPTIEGQICTTCDKRQMKPLFY